MAQPKVYRGDSAKNMSPIVAKATTELCFEVIRAAFHQKDQRLSSRAILTLFSRIANSWDSLCGLLATTQGTYHFEARSIDLAGILRCMYDALIQEEYIAEAKDPEKMGDLYLEFVHVEKHREMEAVLGQNNPLADWLCSSPFRETAEPQIRKNYERVKGLYPREGTAKGPKKKSPGVRQHWYPGDLVTIAKNLNPPRDQEHLWLCKRYNSAIHSGPVALRSEPIFSSGGMVQQLALLVVARGAKSLVRHMSLPISSRSRQIIEKFAVDFIEDIQWHLPKRASKKASS